MGRHIFTPIAQPDKYRYVHGPTDLRLERFVPFSQNFRFFETMGDGSTAHTPDGIVQLQMLPDYLFSLAEAMKSSVELIDAASYELRTPCGDNELEFAYKLKYQEEKPRWFNRQEMKVTASEAKRHDRRYFEVARVMDGSPLGMFHVLCQEHYSGIQKLALMMGVLDWLRRTQSAVYSESATKLLGWDTADRLESAYLAALSVVRANELTGTADRILRHYRQSLLEKTEAIA